MWRGEEEPLWSVQIAEQVKARIKQEMRIPRYKIVVQVIIGEMKDQGVRVASKCLWDADSDNYASYSYRNVSARRPLLLSLPPCAVQCDHGTHTHLHVHVALHALRTDGLFTCS